MKTLLHSKSTQELFKYAIVGCINFSIFYIILKVLVLLGTSVVFANFAGYSAGFLNSFYLNRKWTFKSNGSVKKQGILFSITFLVCYLVQLGVVLLLLDRYKDLGLELTTLAGIVVFTSLNFVLNKTFTFGK